MPCWMAMSGDLVHCNAVQGIKEKIILYRTESHVTLSKPLDIESVIIFTILGKQKKTITAMCRILLALVLGIPCFVSCITYDESGISETEVRLIIIGGIGAGKSTAGNVILGRKVFDANTKSARVTREPATESAYRFNRKIVVTDTPGFYANSKPLNEHILKQITSHRTSGYRAIILVLRIQDFEFNEQIVSFLEDALPIDAFEHLIIIFSNIDALEKNDETLEENIWNYPDSSSVKQLILRTNKRYIGLGYYSKINIENTEQITGKILEIIDKLPKLQICLCLTTCAMEQQEIRNGDNPFTNDDKKLSDIEMKLAIVDCLNKYGLYIISTLCALISLIFLMFVYICYSLDKLLRKQKLD